MQEPETTPNFWIGNAILGVAMVMLLLMGVLWEHLGLLAIVIWAAVVGVGVYFVMLDKRGSPKLPD